MTQELITTNIETLPQILERNKALTERAKLAVQKPLQEAKILNLTTLSIEQINAKEAELKGYWSKLEASLKLNYERRIPATKMLDQIKKEFTGDESELKELINDVKTILSNFNSEKNRRIKNQEEESNKKQAIKIAKIELVSHIGQQINLHYIDMLNDYKSRIKTKYDGLKGEELEDYKNTLKDFKPKFKIPDYGFNSPPELTESEIKACKNEAEREVTVCLAEVFENDIKEYIQIILSGKEDNGKAEFEAEQRVEQAKEEAEKEKINAQFEQPEVKGVIELGKGANVTLKYDCQSHAHLTEIIKWWVANEMNLLTVEEVAKKISFMRTAAGRALNKGEIIEGVPTIEDITMRRTK